MDHAARVAAATSQETRQWELVTRSRARRRPLRVVIHAFVLRKVETTLG
jgi:hypothetical protein